MIARHDLCPFLLINFKNMTKIFMANKKKLALSAFLVAAIVFVVYSTKDDSSAQESSETKKTVAVKVQSAADSKSIANRIKYPATVVGDQEIRITAQASGTAQAVNFDLGDQVNSGRMLAKIDDQGAYLSSGKSGFESAQVQQLESALRQAKESLELTEKVYDDDDSATNRTARDIAKRQYESAKVALDSALNSRIVISPIAGTVTSRNISTGDSITAGQTIATISKTDKLKIQFFVNREELPNMKMGGDVAIFDGNKKIIAKISNISPQADPTTKRFLVEAVPSDQKGLVSGMIVNAEVEIIESVADNGNFILPISSINMTQNENSIFALEGETVKKVLVEVVKISGETAEVKMNLSSDALIIIEGNKLVKDGEKVEVKK